MTGSGWEQLAIQVPVVLVFTGAIFVIMREVFRAMERLIDKFMAFMDIRDKAINESMKALNTTMVNVANCLADLDRRAIAHDQFEQQKWKELEK